MKFKNTVLAGQKGEQTVCAHLLKNGYQILQRNVREKFAEIDIVAFLPKQDTLVFIEVRTRTSSRLGHPVETITLRKQNQVRRAAQWYLCKHQISNTAVRFDVATIIWEENKFEYFENAF